MQTLIRYRSVILLAAVSSLAFVAGRLTHTSVFDGEKPPQNDLARPNSIPFVASQHESQVPRVLINDPSKDADVLSGLLATPAEQLVYIAEGIGRLVALDANATSRAWHSLSTRTPRSDYVGSLVAAYLWSRMAARDAATPLPVGWGLESFPGLISSLAVRSNLNQIRDDLLAGKDVPYAERRLFFEQSMSVDPLGTFSIWLKNHNPDSLLDELPWVKRVIESPGHREQLLTAIEGNIPDLAMRQELLSQLIKDWVAADPKAALEWIGNPRLAAYQDRLKITYADTLCRMYPQAAWALSEDLPRDVRLAAQFSASQILAQEDPQMGIERVGEIQDTKQREEVLSYFGETLAIYHYEEWQKWRDTLPAQEQNKVNEAAFESWVRSDTQGALAWLQTQPPGPAKLNMVSEFASVHSAASPEKVAAWILTLPNANDRLTAVVAGLRGMSDADHEGIRKLLQAAR